MLDGIACGELPGRAVRETGSPGGMETRFMASVEEFGGGLEELRSWLSPRTYAESGGGLALERSAGPRRGEDADALGA